MNDDSATLRVWLDAHGLGDAELLHVLPNHGPDGADRLTDPERRLLSGLLEARRAVVPGDQPSPLDRPSGTEDRRDAAQPVGLFDAGPGGARERAAVEPATGQEPRTGRHHLSPPTGRRSRQRERAEERER
jgi:hypothetical protein